MCVSNFKSLNFQDYLHDLPLCLSIRHSSLLGGHYSVWSKDDLPIGTRFDTYDGISTAYLEEKQKNGYSWQVKKKMDMEELIDAQDKPSWLHFLIWTRNEKANLILIHIEEKSYYINFKLIPANTELLVCHVEDTIRSSEKENLSIDIGQEYHQYNMIFRDISSLKLHKYIDVKKEVFICDLCHDKFLMDSNFRKEPRLHDGMEVQRCNTCCKKNSNGKQYLSLQNNDTSISTSLMIASPQMRKAVEEKTNKNFANNSDVIICKRPIRVRPECDMCKEMFCINNDLKFDKMVHPDDKSFYCITCHKRFRSKYYLQRHIAIHSKVKPFNFYNNLQDHKFVHSLVKPFQCNLCQKYFTTISNLNAHKKIHTGDKPYECDFCNMRFYVRKQLTEHRRIHTGEKPFGCDVCHKRFTRRSHVQRHLKTHTEKACLHI